MKISLKLLSVLFVATSAFGYTDTKLGAVKAYQRTVSIDLDACHETYSTSGSFFGICAVELKTTDELPPNGSKVHVFKNFQNSPDVATQVVIDGDSQSYTISISRSGSQQATDWANAEKFIRDTLNEKLPGSQYNVTVYKIEKE